MGTPFGTKPHKRALKAEIPADFSQLGISVPPKLRLVAPMGFGPRYNPVKALPQAFQRGASLVYGYKFRIRNVGGTA